jgi:hypothetical protein
MANVTKAPILSEKDGRNMTLREFIAKVFGPSNPERYQDNTHHFETWKVKIVNRKSSNRQTMNVRLFKPSVGEEELQKIREAFERSWIGLGPNGQ